MAQIVVLVSNELPPVDGAPARAMVFRVTAADESAGAQIVAAALGERVAAKLMFTVAATGVTQRTATPSGTTWTIT